MNNNITLIYNIKEPERGGVGRYTYELLVRLRKRIEFNEIDLSSSFGKNNLEKLFAILWKRKVFLMKNVNKYGDVNHFLQAEIYYTIEGRKNIVTFHNPPPFTKTISEMYPGYYNFIRSILFWKRYQEAVENADIIIANSQLTKEGILELGYEEERIKVIPLGVDEKFRINVPWSKRKNVIGYLGSFATHKRVDKLLRDWKVNFDRTAGYKLKLYGFGGTKFQDLKQVYDGKLNIIFEGRAKEVEIVKILNSFKAFVFPSKGESFGLPIIEAIACGTPTFVYVDSIITPEVKKYAIEIENVSEIPEILEKIKMKKLIKKSKEVKKEFNWDRNVSETVKIYRKL